MRCVMTAARLGEFQQNAPRAGGMYESDERAACAEARRFVNKLNAARFEFRKFGMQVGDFNAQVMHACAAFGEKSADGRVSAGRFEQFEAARADGQEGDAHALLFDDFDCFEFESQTVAPEL